jgi:hypothetical protein
LPNMQALCSAQGWRIMSFSFAVEGELRIATEPEIAAAAL